MPQGTAHSLMQELARVMGRTHSSTSFLCVVLFPPSPHVMMSALVDSVDQFVSAIPRSLAQLLVSATMCNSNKESFAVARGCNGD